MLTDAAHPHIPPEVHIWERWQHVVLFPLPQGGLVELLQMQVPRLHVVPCWQRMPAQKSTFTHLRLVHRSSAEQHTDESSLPHTFCPVA